MANAHKHTFPGAHGLQLINLLKRFQIPSELLLEGSGLTLDTLAKPGTRIDADVVIALTEKARALTGEPGIGFYLGLEKRLSMYGYLGFATMSATTGREGLELFTRYAATISTSLELSLAEAGGIATLTMHERIDMGSVHDVALFSLMVGIRQLATTLLGRDTGPMQVDLPIAEPEYFHLFAHLLPHAHFDQSIARVHFDSRALDHPLPHPDQAALELAKSACEQQLQELGLDRSLPARVRRLLRETKSHRTIEQIAVALSISTRTLKRKLAKEGLSFKDIQEEERRERAMALLRTPDLGLEAIAEQLDYADASNFTRAFRRWTGMTPSDWRRRN